MFETIVPGKYPGRTRHYHVKVQAPGRSILTTQLYFPGEPGNDGDRIFEFRTPAGYPAGPRPQPRPLRFRAGPRLAAHDTGTSAQAQTVAGPPGAMKSAQIGVVVRDDLLRGEVRPVGGGVAVRGTMVA